MKWQSGVEEFVWIYNLSEWLLYEFIGLLVKRLACWLIEVWMEPSSRMSLFAYTDTVNTAWSKKYSQGPDVLCHFLLLNCNDTSRFGLCHITRCEEKFGWESGTWHPFKELVHIQAYIERNSRKCQCKDPFSQGMTFLASGQPQENRLCWSETRN